MQLLNPSVKSGQFLAAAPFFAAIRPNSWGHFRDPKSQIIRLLRMSLHFKQKFLLQSVRYAPFVQIAKCRDRAARSNNILEAANNSKSCFWKYMAWRLREWELATLKSYNEEKPTWYIFENYQLHYDVLMAYIIIKVCHTRIAFIPQTVVFLIKPSFERETVHTHACFLAAKNSIRERPCVNRQNISSARTEKVKGAEITVHS